MTALTDNELMMKIKSGQTEKMGLLYERHKKKLFGFFYNMQANAALSEDLVQNVFMRMLKYSHTFTGKGSFMAWMFSTARNVYYDHYKKTRKKMNERELTVLEYRLESASNLEDEIADNENSILLKEALGLLDPGKREVLVLSKLKEMKFSEIANILGCSEGAAKVKAHRALKDLRTVFLRLEKR